MTAEPVPVARRVAVSLVRTYRPIVLWTVAVTAAVAALSGAVLGQIHFYGTTVPSPESGHWLAFGGLVSKWWLFVVGIRLVTTDLRTYLANGVTRRGYTAGAALFGLGATVVLTVGVVLGAVLENVVVHAVRHAALGSELKLDGVLIELGNRLPISLAYLISGALISTGFYRFPAWAGTVAMVPALVPLVVTESLLGIADRGGAETPPMVYPAALAIVLAVSVAGAVVVRGVLAGVAVRPAPR